MSLETLAHWLYDRPYSIVTSTACAGVGVGLHYIWINLLLVGPFLWVGLMGYVEWRQRSGSSASSEGEGQG